MNKLAAITIAALTIILADCAYTFCYTTNDHAFGGHLPFLLIVASPILAYGLGRLASEL